MKVLIIDDSENIRNAVSKALKLLPNVTEIFQSFDVEDGIGKIILHSPDIVILDLMLKTGTGFDVVRGIKNLDNKPYIILYSNFLSKEYIKLAKTLEINAFFDKSSEILELVDLVKDIKLT